MVTLSTALGKARALINMVFRETLNEIEAPTTFGHLHTIASAVALA